MSTELEVKNVLGVPILAVRSPEVLDFLEERIDAGESVNIGVVNAAKVVNMRRDAELAESVLSSDIILADGMGVVWASRLLGCALPERVTGIDLMDGLLRLADRKAYNVFFLGAEESVSAKVEEKVREQYPNLGFAGRRNGYFDDVQEQAIAEQIRDAGTQILFVAITSPKKENFMAKWESTMNLRICHGVGGSFDVMAGKVQRAPEIWQKLGMEWLYRVLQEPGRLWKRYLVTNLRFGAMVIKARLGGS